MTLETWAQVALIVIAATILVSFVVLTVFAISIYRQLRGLIEKVRPLMSQAEEVLNLVRGTVVTVGEHAEKATADVTQKAQRIAALSERLAERVAQRVDTTSAIVQEAVARPAIHLASLRTGIGKGLEVWQALSKPRGGNGK